MSFFGGIVEKLLGGSNVVGDVTGFLAKRAELKQQLELAKLQGDIEIEKAKASYRIADLQYDDAWELAQIQNSKHKDEWVLLVLSVPLVLCFIPPCAPWVLRGFEILAQCPDWYRWLVVMIFAAVYGIRVWRRQDGQMPKV